jgi:hypothetical protein
MALYGMDAMRNTFLTAQVSMLQAYDGTSHSNAWDAQQQLLQHAQQAAQLQQLQHAQVCGVSTAWFCC